MICGGGCNFPRMKRYLFLSGIVSEHLPRMDWGVFLLGRRWVSRSAPEKIPFSAWNRFGAPSAQDLGRFSAREAVGYPFCAGKDTFFCPECLRSTFRAGIGVFFCLGGGWCPVRRRKRCLFLPESTPRLLLRREMGKKKRGSGNVSFRALAFLWGAVFGVMLAMPRKLQQMPK